MIVYHGSNNEFDKFDTEKSSGMIWLTTNKEYAEQFGSNVKVFEITASNCLDVTDYTAELAIEQWKDILDDMNINPNDIDWDIVDFAPDYGYYYFYDLLPHAGNNYADAGTLEAIKDAGYDYIIAPPEYCEGVCSDTTIVVFSQDNLKEVSNG